ncbi:MAG: arsenate reductase family protein [Christensenellales bacterium]|jgi:arsenate reductase
MNIQIYWHKRNFDTQKAERYLKERRVPFQMVDLKKHRLGKREAELFLKAAGGLREALDMDSEAVKSHPIAYTNDREHILGYLVEQPTLLKTPIIRDGNTVIIGFDEAQLSALIAGR